VACAYSSMSPHSPDRFASPGEPLGGHIVQGHVEVDVLTKYVESMLSQRGLA
jgi:riboflavin synthase alpha subunit